MCSANAATRCVTGGTEAPRPHRLPRRRTTGTWSARGSRPEASLASGAAWRRLWFMVLAEKSPLGRRSGLWRLASGDDEFPLVGRRLPCVRPRRIADTATRHRRPPSGLFDAHRTHGRVPFHRSTNRRRKDCGGRLIEAIPWSRPTDGARAWDRGGMDARLCRIAVAFPARRQAATKICLGTDRGGEGTSQTPTATSVRAAKTTGTDAYKNQTIMPYGRAHCKQLLVA